MQIFAYTTKGSEKKENEDRIIVGKSILSNGYLECEYQGGVIAIADGVGGNKAGAVASHFVAERICKESEISLEYLTGINNMLVEKSRNDESLLNMATTLTGIVEKEQSLQLFHVGNTRLYSLSQRGYLTQITTDDTTVQHLISLGQLTEDEALNYEKRNEITACLGGGDSSLFNVKIKDIPMQDRRFILTCDGIHDYVSLDELEDLLASAEFNKDVLQKVVNTAREHGSMDDASIVIITE